MAFDAFLKIDGVDGESTRKGFEKQMEIESFNWGVANPVTIGSGTGGVGGGKATVTSFSVTKKSDKASAVLFQACLEGTHYPKALVTLNKAGGKSPVDFLKYEFEKVYVENMNQSGASGGDDSALEQVSFVFGKVSMTYTPQNPDGTKGSPMVASWDLTAVSG
ncbi:MAG: Hcp family type VI secretion system effector [bacterium]